MFENVSPDILNVAIVVAFVVLGFVVSRVALAMAGNENAQRLLQAWNLVDDSIIDIIMFVAASDLDLAPYQDAADEHNMDVRMYWLVQEVEGRAATYLGYTPDFLELYYRAQRIYEELKADESTIV